MACMTERNMITALMVSWSSFAFYLWCQTSRTCSGTEISSCPPLLSSRPSEPIFCLGVFLVGSENKWGAGKEG